jgi:hypothetical protein
MLVLNIAAGKFLPEPIDKTEEIIPRYILNVDSSYFDNTKGSDIELDINQWKSDRDRITKTKNLNMDIFKFMERTSIIFDRVVVYRFLEHVTFTNVEYFIYLISTVIKKGAMVDVIVPNYIQLAEMILNDSPEDPDFKAKNIILTTELLNEPSCPHASIWTPERAKYFFELEKRFKVIATNEAYNFDGRDIYLRFIAERI